jgi:CheY-like chemotaxis protein
VSAGNRPKTRHRIRILAVDDNRLSLRMSSEILRREDYEVIACWNSIAATKLLQADTITLAILDYRMPANERLRAGMVLQGRRSTNEGDPFLGRSHSRENGTTTS